MRSGQKSELIQLLEASTMVECPEVDVKVFYAAAVVSMLPPGKSENFQMYFCISQLCHQTSTEYQKNRFDMGSILQKQPKAEYKGGERPGSTVYKGVCAIMHPF